MHEHKQYFSHFESFELNANDHEQRIYAASVFKRFSGKIRKRFPMNGNMNLKNEKSIEFVIE